MQINPAPVTSFVPSRPASSGLDTNAIIAQVLRTVYCTPYTVHCTLYAIYHSLYTLHHILCTINCTAYTVHYTLYGIYCALYSVHYTQCTSLHPHRCWPLCSPPSSRPLPPL